MCGARGSARASWWLIRIWQRPCGGGVAKWAQHEMGLAGWEGSCSFTRRRVNYGLVSGKRFLKLNSIRLEALCRHTTFLWLMVSLFTSCWRCSGKKKTLLYIFHVPFSYTTLFSFPPLLSPTSPFSKVPTTSTDCVHLKWEDFEVQFFLVVFIQANFLYFCGLLGATYSSIWSGKYGHSVFGLAILIL